jgi:hypothetical protein
VTHGPARTGHRLRGAALASAYCLLVLLIIAVLSVGGTDGGWHFPLLFPVIPVVGVMPVIWRLMDRYWLAGALHVTMFVSPFVFFWNVLPLYHAVFGHPETAIVTQENSDYQHLMAADDERDLGVVEDYPGDPDMGDRIEVSVDPFGWAEPVAPGRLDATALPATLVAATVTVAVALPIVSVLTDPRRRVSLAASQRW